MPNELDPVVGRWYLHLDKGETFRVVAVDAATRSIEIQNFDGDVEEFDMDAWHDMDIDAAEAPEDWTGPFDDIEPDDLGYTETEMSPEDWREPLQPIAVAEEAWQNGRAPDEIEEEEEGRPLELYAEEDATHRQRT